MVSVQLFVDLLHMYQMRFHFSHITKDDWYKPYKGKRTEFKLKGSTPSVVLGFKSLHFDWWGSRHGCPCNSVGVYYPVRSRWSSVCYEHKSLYFPDLLRILLWRRFEKRAVLEAERRGLKGLGALFA